MNLNRYYTGPSIVPCLKPKTRSTVCLAGNSSSYFCTCKTENLQCRPSDRFEDLAICDARMEKVSIEMCNIDGDIVVNYSALILLV